MMGQILTDIFKNKIFMTTVLSWVITQTIKVTIGIIGAKRFDFRWFVGTGGMPSAHAAGAACLAAAVGFECGFASVYFAIVTPFALVVIFDAQGMRRAAGRQARILNKITEDIYWKGRISEDRLRELVGHTPFEVIVGIIIGIVIAFLRR